MLEAVDLTKIYKHRGSEPRKVVDSVSMTVDKGETVGLVGPSGSGKSTVAMMAMKLLEPSSGRILLDGVDVTDMSERAFRPMRRSIQMIMQNPYASLDPSKTVQWSLDEAYLQLGERPDYESILKEYSLPANILHRKPMTLSGGELQRIAIIRALASNPGYLILDEATSMLDMSLQASIINLIMEKHRGKDKGMLVISHDSALIECVCDRSYTLKEGRIADERRCGEDRGGMDVREAQAPYIRGEAVERSRRQDLGRIREDVF